MHRRLTALAFFISFCLVGCGGTPHASGDPRDVAAVAPIATSPEVGPIDSSDQANKEQAQLFDTYLQQQLPPPQIALLQEDCEKHPNDSIFCYGLLNKDRLEKLVESSNKVVIPRSGPAVHAKFNRGKIKNWLELRFASIGSLIRGISSARPSELTKLLSQATKENSCPNNIAIAAATSREELLPERASPKEIARLYQKGGDCITKDPTSRESLLTRAGLFYYLDKKYEQAEALFLQASQTKTTYVGRAMYWLYRSRQARGHKIAAKAALEQLKARYPFSFHTLVALTATNQDPGDILLRKENSHVTRSKQHPTMNPLIEEVEILRQYGYKESASKVLKWAIADSLEAEPEVRLYLAELKPDDENYRSKITLLSDVLYKNPQLISRQTMELYFPKVLFPIFAQNTTGLDPYLLLSVARQESAFDPGAVSVANARGLLQLNVSTGKHYQNAPPANLFNPSENVRIAAMYLTDLLKKSNGQIHLALAAYNAGENRVSAWTTRYATDEPILFIDLIPYRETRDYVASILRNYYWYKRIHQNESPATNKQLFNLDVTKN